MNDLTVRARARLSGLFTFEWYRPFDPVEAKRIRLRFGSQSPQYRSIPRFLLGTDIAPNIVVAEGLNHILDVEFHAATQLTTWYCLIFETDTSPADGTTYAVPVWTECTAYDEGTRPEYEEAAASSKSITNSANKAVFTMNATKTVYGAALVAGGTDANTKGDAAGGGTLYCASKLGTSRAVVDDDVLNLTYAVSSLDDA